MIHNSEINQSVLLKDLYVGYRSDEPIISAVNCGILPGEMVSLVGRNGSGKSTLIRTMAGMIPALDGEYTLNGVRFSEMNISRKAITISYVTASMTYVPDLTVFELVSLGRHPYSGLLGRLTGDDRKYIMKSLEWVGMTSFSDRRFEKLSDGEKQRVMVARAIAQDTPVVLLDEPTAFLDLPNKFELIQLLSSLREKGKTIIFSTHDLETAWLWADKFWVIENGHIVEGAPEDLGISGIYDRLFKNTPVSFNNESRRFEVRRDIRLNIHLGSGDPFIIHWTTRALLRAGISTDKKRKAAYVVEMSESENGRSWIIKTPDGDEVFWSLYELVNYLTGLF